MEMNCRTAEKRRTYRYPCHQCSRNFTKRNQAAQHLLTVHNIVISCIDKYCFDCNAEFNDYANHTRIHSCNFACRFCGSKFLTQEKALKHEEKHSMETLDARPFKCLEKDCTLSFKNINHLKSHQQSIHLQQERTFQCKYCEKKFCLKTNLTAHIRQHYVLFPCNFQDCHRQYKKLNNLKQHMERDHGLSELYLCNLDLCQERFKTLKELKQHRESDHKVAFNIHKYFGNTVDDNDL